MCAHVDGLMSCNKERAVDAVGLLILSFSDTLHCLFQQGHTGCVNCLEWNEQGE